MNCDCRDCYDCYYNLLEGQNRWTKYYTEVRCLLIGIYGASCNSMYILNAHFVVFQKDIIYLCNQIEQSISPTIYTRLSYEKRTTFVVNVIILLQ